MRITDYSHLIPNHQFGFRKHYSTDQQIHRVTNKILTDFDNKNFCVEVFLDISKAFDQVWHEGLLHKLKTMLPSNLYSQKLHQRLKFFVKYN